MPQLDQIDKEDTSFDSKKHSVEKENGFSSTNQKEAYLFKRPFLMGRRSWVVEIPSTSHPDSSC